jgi:hypothetical protein
VDLNRRNRPVRIHHGLFGEGAVQAVRSGEGTATEAPCQAPQMDNLNREGGISLLKKLSRALGDYEVLMLVVMAIFAFAFIVNVQDNPRAGRLFPTYIGMVTLALIAIESIVIFRKKRKAARESDALSAPERGDGVSGQKGLVAKFIASTFLYYLAILGIGYYLASVVFLAIIMYILGIKSKLEILLITLGTMAVLYVVFAWGFGFILPTGFLF